MKAVVCFILLLCVSFTLAQANCKLSGKDNKGDFTIDLNSIASNTYYEVNPSGDWKYLVNFCKGTGQACEEKGANFKALQVNKFNPWCYYLGASGTSDDSEMTLINTNDAEQGVYLAYTKGEDTTEGTTRSAYFTFNCDKTASTPVITFSGEEPAGQFNRYRFAVTSAAACPIRGVPPGPGGNNYPLGQLGVGGLLLVIGAAGILAYFVVGALVMKFKFQKTGVEIVPNLNIWKECVLLPKDGVMLIVDGIKSLTNRGGGAYTEVK
jgi:hypothetical protein